MTPRVTFGHWGVCYMKCAAYNHRSERMTWKDSTRKSRRELSIEYQRSKRVKIYIFSYVAGIKTSFPDLFFRYSNDL